MDTRKNRMERTEEVEIFTISTAMSLTSNAYPNIDRVDTADKF